MSGRLIRYECKNIAGQLLIKYRPNVTQIWKVDLPQGNIVRHCIYIKQNGENRVLQEYKSPDVRNIVLEGIVADMKSNKTDLLVVPYLYCYKTIEDDKAFRVLQRIGYNKSFLNVAFDVAISKCREWNHKGAGMHFIPELLQHEDLDIAAYQHGWGLKIPHKVLMEGINPYQFYKYILQK